MKENLLKAILMKVEMKMAMETFKKRFKKVPKGIQKIYEGLMLYPSLSNPDKVEKEYVRFFGYLKKSKGAKEKWENEL